MTAVTEQAASTVTAEAADYLARLVEADHGDHAPYDVDPDALVALLSRYVEALAGRYDADFFGEECPVCWDTGKVQEQAGEPFRPCPHCLYGVEVWRA